MEENTNTGVVQEAGQAAVQGPAMQEPVAAEPATGPEAGPQAEPDETQARAEKIANRIVARKLSEAGFTKKGDLEAFREWQEAQKSPEQKESEEVARLREELAAANEKATMLDRRQAVMEAKVDPSFTDFVVYTAGKAVDEDNDFATALSAFLEANPQYTAKHEYRQTPPFASGTGTAPVTGEIDEYAKRVAKYRAL